MDSCQLMRKETKMHLNQKQLATRWNVGDATLERWQESTAKRLQSR